MGDAGLLLGHRCRLLVRAVGAGELGALMSVECRFLDGPAIAEFDMDEGCLCYPDDRVQALCPQHIVSANPLGSMTLRRELEPDACEWMRKTGYL